MTTVPEGYRSAQVGDARVVAREDAVAFVQDAIESAGTLYNFARRHPDAETIQGRQKLYIIPGPGSPRWVVRQLSHGGLLAPITGKRFFRSGKPRPLNELQLSVKLQQLGILTPNVVAAVVYSSRFSYHGEMAREEVGNARDLADCLFAEPDLDPLQRASALAAAGRLIGALHRTGVLHPDLNLKNILIADPAGEPQAYILDIEKCRIVSNLSGGQREAMVARISRSAHKFEIGTGRHISAEISTSLSRPWSPFTIRTADFETPSFLDRKAISSSFAAPSTGGAARRILIASP